MPTASGRLEVQEKRRNSTLTGRIDVKRVRDRLLANPGFHRLISRFRPTRGLARRRNRELFDIVSGFVYSQVLYACVRLNLFDHLSGGPLSAAEVASTVGITESGAQRLLLAACSLRLVERRRGGTFGLGELGAAILGNPGVVEMVEHHALLYKDLEDPVALLQANARTRLSRYWAYAADADPAALPASEVSEYSRLMSVSQEMILDDILDSCRLAGRRHLLDLAGGEGVFAVAAARRWPELAVTILDLPCVVSRASERVEREGLSDRIRTEAGDLFSASPPGDFDAVSLVRVLHDHDDEPAAEILSRAWNHLRPGGILLIAEPMAGTPGAEPVGDAYFGFYLLAMGSGRPRTRREIGLMVREAGFRRFSEHKTARPLLVRVLVAEK